MIPKLVSVIVPTVLRASLQTTLKSIHAQSYDLVDVIVVDDSKRNGAAKARNTGADRSTGEFLLFCDDDVVLAKDAVQSLVDALVSDSSVAYSYGWYRIDGIVVGRTPFNAKLLREKNFISTMSLIRSSAFMRFDERMPRWQDWEMWVRMLQANKVGKFVDTMVFTTTFSKRGISGDPSALKRAQAIMRERYGIIRNL